MKLKILFIILLLIISGCAASVINLDVKKTSSSYSMFGKNESRNFYLPVSISDSLKLKWEAEINGSFPNSSVTAYENYVFINDLSGRVYCFDAGTGKVAGKLKHSGAVFTTPVIKDGIVIFAAAHSDENASDLCYYDFREGELLFAKEITGRILTEIIKTDEGVIFNTEDGKVFKYDFNGEELWGYDTKSRVHSSPALGNNIIVFGNDDGEIIGINSKLGNLVYKEKIGEPFFGGTTIDGNTVYVGNDDGYIYALNLTTGKVKWKYDTGWRIIMVPAFNNTDLFVGNLKGELLSLKKETGELNWKTATGGLLNATPLITENIIVLPDLDRSFHLIDVQNGEIISTTWLDGRSKLSPVIYNDLLYIGYDNGILRAYEFVN